MALFVVASAFQALNAAEARAHHGLDPTGCDLFVLTPPTVAGRRALDWVVAQTGWPNHRAVGPPATSNRAWLRRVRGGRRVLTDAAAEAGTVFVGDYRNQLARHAAHPAQRVVVLDDGNATKLVAAWRGALLRGEPPPFQLTPQVPRAQEVAARLLGLRLGHLPAVTFFSMYDVDVEPPDTLVRHDYPWLRSRFGAPAVVDEPLFLGAPLVEMGIASEEVYERGVRAAGAGSYKAHPAEDPARVAALAQRLGLHVVEIPTPVELGILVRGEVPSEVWSFYSTALESLSVILRGTVKVRAVRVPPGAVAPRWRPRVAEAYRSLQEASVELLDL